MKPKRIESLVETVDLLPTLLDLLNIKLPDSRPVSGKNLLPLLLIENNNEDQRSNFVISSARPEDKRFGDKGYKFDTRKG